jgi:hypothetical protein
MKPAHRRIELKPVWREQVDARLYALAVVTYIREQLAEAAEVSVPPAAPGEAGDD